MRRDGFDLAQQVAAATSRRGFLGWLGRTAGAAIALASGGILASPTAHAQGVPLLACYQQFVGMCFHGQEPDLDLTTITSETDAQDWCDVRILDCSYEECHARLKVLASVLPPQETGHPCFPMGPSSGRGALVNREDRR